MVLSLPGEPARLVLDAEVVWTQPAPPQPGRIGEFLRFGVRFDGGALADMKLLRDYAFEAGGHADKAT